ncbi:hypothetical protein pEaSNUABM54_00170 [Erwinia phage pEa_SNUABM_54]|nr:hypothetical protein pEaSNUABM54_00170 [Erwinia phage pEa_SNUABM_54]
MFELVWRNLFWIFIAMGCLQLIGTVCILRVAYLASNYRIKRDKIRELNRLLKEVHLTAPYFTDYSKPERAVAALNSLVENNCHALSTVELYGQLMTVEAVDYAPHFVTHLTAGVSGAALLYARDLLLGGKLSKAQSTEVMRRLDIFMTTRTTALYKELQQLTKPNKGSNPW